MVVAALDEEVGCVFNLCDLGKISGPGSTPITNGAEGVPFMATMWTISAKKIKFIFYQFILCVMSR